MFPTSPGLGTSSWLDWQINFTHMPTVKCFKDLLVCVFSGWVEANITTNKSTSTAPTLLLSTVVSCIGLPTFLQLENGSKLYKYLGIFISHIIHGPLV